MRKKCLDMVYELAQIDDRVIFIGSDLSPGLLGQMQAEYPDRYFMEGISEANVFGMSAGLAIEGYVPYVNTIATFITRRSYEQIAVDLCLHKLPVRLIGNGGGFVYAPLGPTHQAIEDIAAMRCLPNMTVVAVCDANEMERFMKVSLHWPGPIYIRLAKGHDPIVSEEKHGFEIGKAIELKRPKNASVALLSTGAMTSIALETAQKLTQFGIHASVIHHHTIKPLDKSSLIEHSKCHEILVTIEEHTLQGGFGSAIVEVLVDSSIPKMPAILRVGIPDVFAEKYGSQDELLAYFGIDSNSILKRVLKKAEGLHIIDRMED